MLKNQRLSSSFAQLFHHGYRSLCSSHSRGGDTTQSTDPQIPEEPTNCCMSGCEKCVWKQYALDLIEMYDHSGEEARKIILEKIKDPTMKVFLKMELQFLENDNNKK